MVRLVHGPPLHATGLGPWQRGYICSITRPRCGIAGLPCRIAGVRAPRGAKDRRTRPLGVSWGPGGERAGAGEGGALGPPGPAHLVSCGRAAAAALGACCIQLRMALRGGPGKHLIMYPGACRTARGPATCMAPESNARARAAGCGGRSKQVIPHSHSAPQLSTLSFSATRTPQCANSRLSVAVHLQRKPLARATQDPLPRQPLDAPLAHRSSIYCF